jgi:F0F1-type ATP synthase membrane subunit a
MYIAIIGILVIFLVYEELKKKKETVLKKRLESMEKIDDYLNNIIEKNYKNKNKNTRQKNCPISENIINIEKEINKH